MGDRVARRASNQQDSRLETAAETVHAGYVAADTSGQRPEQRSQKRRAYIAI